MNSILDNLDAIKITDVPNKPFEFTINGTKIKAIKNYSINRNPVGELGNVTLVLYFDGDKSSIEINADG